MAEYQPLSLPETVRIKLNHWLYPDDPLPDDDSVAQRQIPDVILFQLIQDVGSAKGGQRWRKHHELPLYTRYDAKIVMGSSAPSQDKNYSSAWMRSPALAYEVRMRGHIGSETFTLFEEKNNTAREVPLSETKLRQEILFVLSELCDYNASLS